MHNLKKSIKYSLGYAVSYSFYVLFYLGDLGVLFFFSVF